MDLHAGYLAADIRRAERTLIDAGEPLMARAAAGLASHIERLLAARHASPGTVILLVGSGDNGGDALFAGASLASNGRRVQIVRLGRSVHEAGLRAALAAGAREIDPSPATVATLAADADVLVDGVVGTGGRGSVRQPAADVIAALTSVDPRPAVVAVDLPSGVDADDGSVHAPMLAPDLTVTFGAMKAGLLRQPGASIAGQVVLVDIGLGAGLTGATPAVPAAP